ncbi:MAG: ATP-binding protein [Pseudomonadales bacterium]|nr:ATP-binding protein [Pseudomonadales bacterium]
MIHEANEEDQELHSLVTQAEEVIADHTREVRALEKANYKAFKWPDPEDWMGRYELSDEEIAEMQDAKFIISVLVISGQLTVIAAKPGSGKTSVMMREVGSAVKAGYRVVYVNMDCGAADVKYWHRLAKEGGFRMITPHFSGAGGVDDWLVGLALMANRDGDLSELLIVIDTLKKIGDLMNKTRMKYTMNLLRALTAKGATVVCLAHCNKHRDAAGKLVFEGVGDVESDCDNLVYLESEKDKDGIRTVSTEPSDKVRGIFTPRSWRIHPDRTVEALESFVDVKATAAATNQREKDETAIDVITEGIKEGHHKRVALLAYCLDSKISKREFDAVIKRYCQGHTDAKTTPLWRNEKQFRDNANYYTLLESRA